MMVGKPPHHDIDLGLGYFLKFFDWSPDRSIPANAEKFKYAPDTKKLGAIVYCPHDAGVIHFDYPWASKISNGPFWQIECWEPFTISPSVLCKPCGCHGFIREGKWVPA